MTESKEEMMAGDGKIGVFRGRRKKMMATVVVDLTLVGDEISVGPSKSKLKAEKWWLVAVINVGKAWKLGG